jgi:hypothetical protein
MLTANEQEDLFGNVVADTPTIDRDQLAHALAQTFAGLSLEQIARMITNEYSEILEYVKLARGEDACRRTSLLFNPHRLDTWTAAATRKDYTLYGATQHAEWHKGLARATLIGKYRNNADLMYWCFQLGVNGVGFAAEFPPTEARDKCLGYLLNSGSRVLDPCAGWGGRMLGVSVVCSHYTCYEPSTRTAAGLKQLCDFIRSINSDFEADVICEPYEDSDEIASHYDFALTSPPYYDTENYADEPTNSLHRYKSFAEWVEGFYKPLIDKTMRQLKPGAPFVINVGDRKYPLSDVMREHCENNGYALRRIKGGIVNSAGIGRQVDAGEKFYEITKPDGDSQRSKREDANA